MLVQALPLEQDNSTGTCSTLAVMASQRDGEQPVTVACHLNP